MAKHNISESNVDVILAHYLRCALWASVDEDGEPLDNGNDISDIASCAVQASRESIEDFLNLLHAEGVQWGKYWTFEQFGHDYFLTRNGHGTGFWDRASIDDEEKRAIGDTLTKWSETMGSVDFYPGDDGKVYST